MAQQKTASKSGGKGRGTKRSTKKAVAPRPGRASASHHDEALDSTGDEEVSIDRRRSDQRHDDSKASGEKSPANAPQLERRKKVNRRRQIDPTTCERDYTDEEVEFMNALDDYKRKSGRMFPTCSEVLEVVRSLGYGKLQPAELDAIRGASDSAMSAKPMPSDWDSSTSETIESAPAGEGSDKSHEPQLTY